MFAADIVNHKNCMRRYLLQYQRNAEEIISYDKSDDDSDIDVEEAFRTMLIQLQINTKGYAISLCRDTLNSELNKACVN